MESLFFGVCACVAFSCYTHYDVEYFVYGRNKDAKLLNRWFVISLLFLLASWWSLYSVKALQNL